VFFLDVIFALEVAFSLGEGSLHHLTLHQLSPTPSTLWRDWVEKKRQHRHITHQITGDFDRPYSKKHVAERNNPICVSMKKEQDHGCSKE